MRTATRIVKIVKQSGAFSTDDIAEIFTNLDGKTENEKHLIRIMANTMIELVQQGKFDLRKMS